MHDCVIAGGSFSGSATAKALGRLGVEATVLEEHGLPGKFHKCSGLFSKKGLEATGVAFERTVLNEVRGAIFHSGRSETRIARGGTVAYVCDRQALDEQAASEAIAAGARFEYNRHVESVKQNSEGISLTASGKEYSSRVLVGCDGAQSTIARQAGFPEIPAKDFVLAWESEYVGCRNLERDLVEVFLEPCFAGFFGWMIPVGDDRARVGFATKNFSELNQTKKQFLAFPRVADVLGGKCNSCREFSHLIPLSMRKKTQLGRVVLVGDAAGQVKATTGGGIVFNAQAAKIAAKSIKQFLDGGELDYETAWRRELGKPLGAHRLIRTAYNHAPKQLWPASLKLASALGLNSLVAKFGDMDYVVA